MNKTKSKLFVIFYLLVCLCSLAQSQTTPIQVSCNVPLSGELSTYGTAIEEGVRFYQESLPNDLRNHVVYDWQDNESKGIVTLSVAKMQLRKNPDVYVTGVKPQYMVIEDILGKQNKMPNFAWVFDSFLRAKNNNNFRTWVNFKAEADLFIRFITQKKNIKKIAIIYVITPTVVEQQNSLIIPALDKMGLADHLVIPYQLDQLDFKSIALKVKSYNPDIIYLSGFQHNMTPLIRSFRVLSLIKNDNTVATYDLLDAVNLMRPEELEGIRFTMPAFLISKSKKMLNWKNNFRTRFNKEPLYTNIYAHEMAAILQDVATRRSQNNSKSIIELLANTNIDGLIGKLKFDENGDVQTDVIYGAYKNGTLVNSEE